MTDDELKSIIAKQAYIFTKLGELADEIAKLRTKLKDVKSSIEFFTREKYIKKQKMRK